MTGTYFSLPIIDRIHKQFIDAPMDRSRFEQGGVGKINDYLPMNVLQEWIRQNETHTEILPHPRISEAQRELHLMAVAKLLGPIQGVLQIQAEEERASHAGKFLPPEEPPIPDGLS